MEKETKVRAPRIDKTAISPYENYCDGYGAPGAQGDVYKRQVIHISLCYLLMYWLGLI